MFLFLHWCLCGADDDDAAQNVHFCLENVALKCGFMGGRVQFSVNTCYLFRTKVFSQRDHLYTHTHTHRSLCVLAALALVKAEVVPFVMALMDPGLVLSAVLPVL